MKFTKILPCAAAGIFAISTAATAATFQLVGGTSAALDSDYDLPIPTLPYAIIDFQDTNGPAGSPFGGLRTDVADQQIRATYMGSEAGATNGAELSFGAFTFSNATSTVGDSVVFDNDAFFVDLVFSTNNLGGLDTIDNNWGQATSGDLHMAFTDITNATGAVTEVFAFFGDGAGDSDYDDMVIKLEIISAVPLPAGAVLMASGIAGFGVMRRKKKA